MIALLSGTVVEHDTHSVIVDVHGLGYRVRVLGSLLSTIQDGQAVTLRIYHQVGEDTEALFGFATKEDLRVFELLLTVPSVGPKTAMNILDVAPPRTLAQAVAGKDVKLLTKVSGVGRKTAERILVELQEKFKDVPVSGVMVDIQDEAMSALINMGFSKGQARQAVQGLPTGVASVEEAVRHVLQQKK